MSSRGISSALAGSPSLSNALQAMAGSGTATPEPESEGLVTTSTVTTTVRNRKGDILDIDKNHTDVTFLDAKGVTQSTDPDGGIHLRPLPASARKGRKIRALVNFRARNSRFDRFNLESSKDGFRGFYTLFWIGITLTMLNTFHTTWKSTGHVIDLTFAVLFSRDAKMLAFSDAVLVGSLFLCVPFIKVAQKGWLPYSKGLVLVQHLWQAAMLGAVIKWTHIREWPWVQSGFFVLHTLAMMMKIHSYMSVNGWMADTFWRMKKKEKLLRKKVLEASQAELTGKKEQDKETLKNAWKAACQVALGGSEFLVETDWSNVDAQEGSSLVRHKARWEHIQKVSRTREASPEARDASTTANEKAATSNGHAHGNGSPEKHESKAHSKEMLIRDPHPLATHPDEAISKLACEIEVLREELLSNNDVVDDSHSSLTGKVVWPHNVTYANFWDYLLVPTLVYELEYPRTKSVRPMYVLEKVSATFGTFFVIYVITEHWIIPFQPGQGQSLLGTFLQLAVPMMINYLLIFYIMFECICNAFAEMTKFADREFYSDWWNATSMDIFSRRWNKPVHNFLLRHVYASSISIGASKSAAMFVTFLLSSLLHELVMAIVSGKIRGYLFMMQMAQLPLIVLGQIPVIRRNESLGNLIFWIGLLLGFPLLNILYISY